jgi:hypothetical protein
MKSSLLGLIPFFPFSIILQYPETQFCCTLRYIRFARTEQKTLSQTTFVVVCLPVRCLATSSSIVPRVFVAAGRCSPIRSLAMDISDFTFSTFGRHVAIYYIINMIFRNCKYPAPTTLPIETGLIKEWKV